MSHGIKDGRIYKGTNTSSVIGGIQKSRNRIYKGTSEGNILGGVKGDRIYKGTSEGNILGGVKGDRIYKGTSEGATIMKTSVIHSAIKDSKNYDLALMVAAYHFLIKPIF